jgi:hypothetical protein
MEAIQNELSSEQSTANEENLTTETLDEINSDADSEESSTVIEEETKNNS